MKTAIVWFRNDLRIHDNPALATALQDFDQIIPLFIASKSLLHGAHSSSNRNRFLIECLEDLRSTLRKIGSELVIRSGDAEIILNEIIDETGARSIYYSADYTPFALKRDKHLKQAFDSQAIGFRSFPGRLTIGSVTKLRTKNDDIYKVFTPFWKNWETVARRPLASSPTKMPKLPIIKSGPMLSIEELTKKSDLSPKAVKGGETAARSQMKRFIDTMIDDYAENHNTPGTDSTSRLSPYLHFGCLSPLEIETLLPGSPGARAWHRQLAWREFYNYILFHFPGNRTMEFQNRYRDMNWNHNETLLQAWKDGRTGYPMVDAAMRQLQREGWMHNRARLIVGSFLTKDLLLDWRDGEQYFMQMLLDGDEANNNGNWQWIASVGVDPAPVFRRLYNPSRQQENFDPDHSYVRQYVPELAAVPNNYFIKPWTMDRATQERSKCIIGDDYPKPIVNHSEARKLALDRYRASGELS